MNKTKTILAAVGGVTLAGVAVAGFFAWTAISAKTAALEGDDEGNEGLESVMERAESLMKKAVYPGAESVRALAEAKDGVQAWKDEAFAFVSRGDRRLQPTTDAAFKAFIVGDARRLQALPAGAEKKTLDAAFDFGPFKPYIAEGVMPELTKLRELQRKWDDVAMLIETLSECGVEGITAIEVKSDATAKQEEQPAKKGKKKFGKKEPAAASAAAGSKPDAFTYVISCRMRPASFVKTLNALATGERFTIVSDFTISRDKDMVSAGLGAEKKDEAAAPTGRRRRRGAAATETVAKVEAKNDADSLVTVVADPQEEAPFETKLTVEVCDFRAAEAAEEKKEGEEAK